ncbi:MAG TPA: trypsin-like peptidase domain-containing protein [Blastocatellia bacterium]|nr:trypsin-like peptidase domain-containing protein [Blastocatellia bacterium]
MSNHASKAVQSEHHVLCSSTTVDAKPLLQRLENGRSMLPGKIGESVQIVFPESYREKVDDTKAFPYVCTGELVMVFPDAKMYMGTGVLIGEQYLLTAAHNLYDKGSGGWARSVYFAPGRDEHAAPFGLFPAAKISIPEEYLNLSPPNPNDNRAGNVKDYTKYLFDFGLVQLEKPLEDFPYLGMYAATSQELNDKYVTITGYPSDKSSYTMWRASGTVDHVDEQMLFYQISTCNGVSGGAIVGTFSHLPTAHLPRIVGLHVAGDPRLYTNFGVRLNNDLIDRIISWM